MKREISTSARFDSGPTGSGGASIRLVRSSIASLVLTSLAFAVPTGAAEIEYLAHAAFIVESDAGERVLIDPFASRVWLGYDFPGVGSVDSIVVTHPHFDHDAGRFRGTPWPFDAQVPVVDRPGETRVGSIEIRGVEGKHAEPYGKEFEQRNTIFRLEVDGLSIVHLGDNGPLTDGNFAALRPVDVLMIPIDGHEHILKNEEVEAIIDGLRPRVVIPMHYRIATLETAADSPDDLGDARSWLAEREGVERLFHHRWRAELPPPGEAAEPRVVVFDPSPRISRAPVGDGAAFEDQLVTIPTGDPAVTLAGTLSLPEGEGPHPAVLFLTGSGGHTRHQVISGLPMFDVLGDHLAQHGLAVLRVDDRGVGESTGPHVRQSGMDDRLADAAAAFDYLLERKETDPLRVGLLGHSEGGMTGPRLAVADERVAFLVLLAPPSVPATEIWVGQQGDMLRRDGEMDEEQIVAIEEALLGMVRHIGLEGNTDEGFYEHGRAACLAWGDAPDEVTPEFVSDAFGDLRQPWYEQFFASDPRPDLRRLTQPTLAVFGTADQQVTVALNRDAFVESVGEAINEVTVVVLTSEDHFFMTGDGLAPNEHVYGEMKLSPELLATVTEWLTRTVVDAGLSSDSL